MEPEQYGLLRELILGQFSESYVMSMPSHGDAELLGRVALIQAEKPSLSGMEAIEEAERQLREAGRAVANFRMVEQRNDAIHQLLFNHGAPSITLRLFLRRLLPKDKSLEAQDRWLDFALTKILTTARMSKFYEFQWPESDRCGLAEAEPDEIDLRLAGTLKSLLENGITPELASTYAPLILGWREFKCSPRNRAEMSHDSAKKRTAKKSEKTLDEGVSDLS